jgi:hypothetical protein
VPAAKWTSLTRAFGVKFDSNASGFYASDPAAPVLYATGMGGVSLETIAANHGKSLSGGQRLYFGASVKAAGILAAQYIYATPLANEIGS